MIIFFCKQKTAYEMRISDWSSDVCSSDLRDEHQAWRLGRQNSWQDGSRLCHRSRGSNDNIGFYQAQRDNPRTAGFDLPRYDPSRPTCLCAQKLWRSEEHTSELQSLMRISYDVFCLKKKTKYNPHETI